MPAVFADLATRAAPRQASTASCPTRASSTVTSRARACHCTGPGRARFRRTDRVGVARPAGDVPVRRPEAQRPAAARARSSTATSSCGAARRDWLSTASSRCAEGDHPVLGRQRINSPFVGRCETRGPTMKEKGRDLSYKTIDSPVGKSKPLPARRAWRRSYGRMTTLAGRPPEPAGPRCGQSLSRRGRAAA